MATAKERRLTHDDAMANFATLDSLKKEDEEKEKKGNAYYAGGARGAGQGGRFVLQFCVQNTQASLTRSCADLFFGRDAPWMKKSCVVRSLH